MAPDYTFHPISSGDLSLIRTWLETPEVAHWWGQPAEQYALVSGDRDHPDMDQFIVAIDNHPFGYIQCYAHLVPGTRISARSHPGRVASTNLSASRI
jgi:aminoglycoside 6'-N-acetyltransferase